MTKTMSSSSSSETQSSFGKSIELFNPYSSATLNIMDYNDKHKFKFLRYGGFVINLIIQFSNPIMMINCIVDGLQWPISKDAPIIRVGHRSFAFGIPGVLYGLQFPPSCEDENINALEKVFMKYAHYQHLEAKNSTGYSWKEDDPDFWDTLQPVVETDVHSKLYQFGHRPGKSPFTVGDQFSSIERILRTSAATKMVGHAILSGSLKSNEIEIQDLRPERKSGGNNGCSDATSELAFASISVFANLVEAVELFWVIASGKFHSLKDENLIFKELVGFKMWRLNQLGIGAFLKRFDVE